MLLINTYVAKSKIEGVGVFAADPVKRRQLIWRLEPSFDRLIHRSFLESAPPHLREFFTRYAYPLNGDPETLVFEVDNGRFMNHQDQPNTEYKAIDRGYALRDIEAGEELTCNYAEFDPTFDLLPPFAANEYRTISASVEALK